MQAWNSGLTTTFRVLLIGLLVFTCSAQAQLTLNGMASYEQLSKEYYIVALFTPTPITTPENLLAKSLDKRIEMRLAAKQWTPYSFAQIWKRDLSINNELSAQAPQIERLLAFTSFPKQDLTIGDTLVANYSPSLGTTLTFNGETILKAEGDTLFNYLLSVWVGVSPPSRQFKADLLAGKAVDEARFAGLKRRFESLSIQPERQKLYSQWRQAEDARVKELARLKAEEEVRAREAAEALAAEEAKRAAEQADAAARAKAAAKAKQEAEQVAAVAAGAAVVAKAKAAKAAQKAAQSQASPLTQGSSSEADVKEVEVAEAQAQAEDEKARQAAELAAAQAAEQARAEAEAEALKARQLAHMSRKYARERYIWEIQRAIDKQVTYPEWAKQFGEEGLVKAEFRLDAQGNVIEFLHLSPDENSLLAQELKAAIGRASPFGAVPELVKETTDPQKRAAAQVFKASYTFRLRGEPDPVPPQPVMPEALRESRAEVMTEQDKASLATHYRTSVQRRVEEAIVYPHWAKSMKQTGTVSVRVELSADGQVAGTHWIEESRHVMLNDEVMGAIRRVAPFDPIPEVLGVDRMSVEVSHQFGGR